MRRELEENRGTSVFNRLQGAKRYTSYRNLKYTS
jgi:hypothetical protein